MNTLIGLAEAAGALLAIVGLVNRSTYDFFGHAATGQPGSPSTLNRLLDWLFLLFIALVLIDGSVRVTIGRGVFSLLLNVLINPGV
jgi:hypothetical protein